MKYIAPFLLVGSLFLSACATTPSLQTTTTTPVCVALVGPIKYNSSNPKSLRYAGKKLVPDLRVRNQVGINLRCPAYR